MCKELHSLRKQDRRHRRGLWFVSQTWLRFDHFIARWAARKGSANSHHTSCPSKVVHKPILGVESLQTSWDIPGSGSPDEKVFQSTCMWRKMRQRSCKKKKAARSLRWTEMHNWNHCVVCLWQLFLFSPSPEQQLGLLLRPDRMGKHLLWSWSLLVLTAHPLLPSHLREGWGIPLLITLFPAGQVGICPGCQWDGSSWAVPSAVLKPWADAASADLQTGYTVRLDKEIGKKQSVLPWRCFKDCTGAVFDHSERKSFHDAGNPKDSYCNMWVILDGNEVWTRTKFLCTNLWTHTRKEMLLMYLDTPIWDKKL